MWSELAFLLPIFLIILLISASLFYGFIIVFKKLNKKQKIAFTFGVVLCLIFVDRALFWRQGVWDQILYLAFIALLIVELLIYGLVKLFILSSKLQKITLACAIIVFVSFMVGWFHPVGTLTGNEWQLSSGFRANPRHIQPAPLSIRFFDDGTGTKVNDEGYEQNFEWHITSFDELVLSTRWGSYIVTIYGFGTRLRLEHSLRGEATMGRFDTRQDFRAHYRRSFWN